MNSAFIGLAAAGALGIAGAAALRSRRIDRWLTSYLMPAEKLPRWEEDHPLDVFIAVCDHWEPRCYGASDRQARERVRRWRDEYPRRYEAFEDVDGRPPQHTLFFPEDEYRPEYLDAVCPLVDSGYADVDVHLHHHDDTAAQLRDKLEAFRDVLAIRHGLLRRDPRTGQIVYGFIHGNWALCNSRPDGMLCGVDNELEILLETGCYADFTLPSAPSATQTPTINSIYYAKNQPGQRRSHDRGVRARVGQAPPDEQLLMIQGPLTFDWGWRRWGVVPRIENADVHSGRPMSLRRLPLWIDAGVHVAGRPEWRFIKLHTHGCKDGNIDAWLGESMLPFHRDLAELHRRQPNFRYHYVTAWEMALLVRRAEQGAGHPGIAAPLRPELRYAAR